MTVARVALAVDCPDAGFDAALLEGRVNAVLRAVAFPGDLSLAVVDDGRMRQLNRDYHAVDEPTDVLAFPLSDGGPGFAAEVIVSWDTARREAASRGVEPEAELMLYVVHGILHLMGEDDHDPQDAQRMHQRTLAILGDLGLCNTIEVPDPGEGAERVNG